MSGCRRVLPLLDPYVDGELAPDKIVEIREHLVDCTVCAERVRLSHALHVSVQRVVREDAAPTPAFADRIRGAMEAERRRESLAAYTPARETGFATMMQWRTIVPVAAAASLTLAWAASTNEGSLGLSSGQPSHTASNMTSEDLIEQFLDYHARAPAPDITDPWAVRRLEPELGMPVQLPDWRSFNRARWEGGSIVPGRAASLRYSLDGHPVTVYVYNATRFPLRATLEPRVVRDAPVYVGSRRGYSIGVRELRGMGYAVTSDLTDSETAELVADIRTFH
jgi:anti-sigma factor RsiW